MKSECQECGKAWELEELEPAPPRPPVMYEPDPDGECPACGGDCYPDPDVGFDREPPIPFEESESYRQSMVDAGRGHLIRW